MQILLALITGLLTGGGFVALVRYFQTRPLTRAKAKEIEGNVSIELINKWEEYCSKIEKRLDEAIIKIDDLRQENFNLIMEVKDLKQELAKYQKAIGGANEIFKE